MEALSLEQWEGPSDPSHGLDGKQNSRARKKANGLLKLGGKDTEDLTGDKLASASGRKARHGLQNARMGTPAALVSAPLEAATCAGSSSGLQSTHSGEGHVIMSSAEMVKLRRRGKANLEPPVQRLTPDASTHVEKSKRKHEGGMIAGSQKRPTREGESESRKVKKMEKVRGPEDSTPSSQSKTEPETRSRPQPKKSTKESHPSQAKNVKSTPSTASPSKSSRRRKRRRSRSGPTPAPAGDLGRIVVDCESAEPLQSSSVDPGTAIAQSCVTQHSAERQFVPLAIAKSKPQRRGGGFAVVSASLLELLGRDPALAVKPQKRSSEVKDNSERSVKRRRQEKVQTVNADERLKVSRTATPSHEKRIDPPIPRARERMSHTLRTRHDLDTKGISSTKFAAVLRLVADLPRPRASPLISRRPAPSQRPPVWADVSSTKTPLRLVSPRAMRSPTLLPRLPIRAVHAQTSGIRIPPRRLPRPSRHLGRRGSRHHLSWVRDPSDQF